MAVRVFSYRITDKENAAAGMPQVGVQGEHRTTKIELTMDKTLADKLLALASEGKVFSYHFDRYDGIGGKSSTEPKEFKPKAEAVFSHYIERSQTKYGGTIQLYFVITLTDVDKTEMEVYAYNIKMMLKPLPVAAELDGEDYASVATLAMSAKANSKTAENAAAIASDAMVRTESARAALEGGTEWVFDGGDASDELSIDFVAEKTDYIVKQGQGKFVVFDGGEEKETGFFYYEKWKSGIVKCWGRTDIRQYSLDKKYYNSYYIAAGDFYVPEGIFKKTYPTVGSAKFVLTADENGLISGGTYSVSTQPSFRSVGCTIFETSDIAVKRNGYIAIEINGRWK